LFVSERAALYGRRAGGRGKQREKKGPSWRATKGIIKGSGRRQAHTDLGLSSTEARPDLLLITKNHVEWQGEENFSDRTDRRLLQEKRKRT